MPTESDKMTVAAGPSEIGVVVYPDVQLAAVHGLTDLFELANRLAVAHRGGTVPALRVTHWRLDAGGRAVECGYDTHPQTPPQPAIILIPLLLVDMPAPEVTAPLAQWLRAQHARGAIVASICSGVFLLAQAGLLAGRPASTHWSYLEPLAARFPDVRFDTETRFIDHGDVMTAGGFMAWIDLGFRLVGRMLGPTIGTEVERFIAGDPRSASGERRYLNGFSPKLLHGDAAILRAQHWLHGRDAREVSLAAMADQARLEKRTFSRRFLRATGVTPLVYCRNVRIARARELLEFSMKTIKVIAWEVGYHDPVAFARAFQKATGQSPGDYRRRYGPALDSGAAARNSLRQGARGSDAAPGLIG